MKILIVGSVASGKTTFAEKLSKKLNIKHFEIDSVVHDDEAGTKRSEEEQQKIFDKINSDNNWIIEGTLRKNLYYLLDYADKIIFLDISVRKRKIRIITRFIKQILKIEKCNYKPTFKMFKFMFKWTNDFENKREEFESKLIQYKDKLIKLNSDEKINNYIIKE